MSTSISHQSNRASEKPLIDVPPSAHARVPATIGHHAASVPQDIVNQIMHWMVRSEGATRSIESLGCVSRGWNKALTAFYSSNVYAEVRSLLMHHRAIAWTRYHLDGFGDRPLPYVPEDVEHLRRLLNKSSQPQQVPRHRSICIADNHKSAFTGDWLQAFRDYQGESVMLKVYPTPWAVNALIEAERVLPPDVALGVEFVDSSLGDAECAEALKALCATGRMISLNFSHGADISEQPSVWSTLVKTMCGAAHMAHVQVLLLADPGQTLRTLAENCDQLRHLKLLAIHCNSMPDYQDVEALALALCKRHEAGRSRVTVALSLPPMFNTDLKDKPLFYAEARQQVEDSGLYFGVVGVDGGNWLPSDFFHKVRASIGNGPIDQWYFGVVEGDEFSDSDVIVESRVEESDSDKSGERIEYKQPDRTQDEENDRTRTARRPQQGFGEFKAKKRDKCVIS